MTSNDEHNVPSVKFPETTMCAFGCSQLAKHLDDLTNKAAADSDKDYREITKGIVEKTNSHLTKLTESKKPLRDDLKNFIKLLLSIQFIALILIIFMNRLCCLNISDYVISTYIISVFVETLAGLIIMITFAFNSSQEVELIRILNSVVDNFQKYTSSSEEKKK